MGALDNKHEVEATLPQVCGQIQQTIPVMQDNMQAMAERDLQLINLEGKSEMLQGASTGFAKRAKCFRDQLMWKKYQLYVAIPATITWIVALVVFRHYLIPFLLFTLTFAAAAYFDSRYPWPPVGAHSGRSNAHGSGHEHGHSRTHNLGRGPWLRITVGVVDDLHLEGGHATLVHQTLFEHMSELRYQKDQLPHQLPHMQALPWN